VVIFTTGIQVVVFDFLNLNIAENIGRFWRQEKLTPVEVLQNHQFKFIFHIVILSTLYICIPSIS